MDPSNLKQILEAFKDASGSAQQAFIWWIIYQLSITLILTGSTVFCIYYVASRLIGMIRQNHQVDRDMTTLYHACCDLMGRSSSRYPHYHDMEEIINTLKSWKRDAQTKTDKSG
jgi:hypothetical protein